MLEVFDAARRAQPTVQRVAYPLYRSDKGFGYALGSMQRRKKYDSECVG